MQNITITRSWNTLTYVTGNVRSLLPCDHICDLIVCDTLRTTPRQTVICDQYGRGWTLPANFALLNVSASWNFFVTDHDVKMGLCVSPKTPSTCVHWNRAPLASRLNNAVLPLGWTLGQCFGVPQPRVHGCILTRMHFENYCFRIPGMTWYISYF